MTNRQEGAFIRAIMWATVAVASAVCIGVQTYAHAGRLGVIYMIGALVTGGVLGICMSTVYAAFGHDGGNGG